MTRSAIESSLTELNSLVLESRMMEAFERFYHDDVIMQENTTMPTVSKAANRLREQDFVNNITEFRKAEVAGIAFGDDISFVIWDYDYTHREWGVRNYTQVSIQHWKDGSIIKEQFIYNS